MNGRERIEAAFSRERAEQLPTVICYENVFLRDHWFAFTGCPWWYLHMPDAERQLAWTSESLESVPLENLPASFDAIEAAIPDPAVADARALHDRQSVADALIREFGSTLWPHRHVSRPLWKTYGLWGFEGMMTMIASRPELVRFACERFLAAALRNVQEAADHGAAGV